MRGTVCLLALALAVCLASAQVNSAAFQVTAADQVCRTAADCTSVASTCCPSSSCDTFQAVSVSALPKYEALLQTYISQSCTTVRCTQNVCPTPTLDCVAGANGGSTCQIVRSVNPCPTGVPQVQCLVDPCAQATCPSHPGATCRANYCGGCNAEFFDANGAKVDCSQNPDPCNGLPMVNCLVDPCLNKRCEANPSATCRANYCGGCNFDFFDANGGKVDCAPKPDPCNGLPIAQCIVDPCLNKRCEANPSATCKANYCGGCNFDFFDANGGKVDCAPKPDPCNGLPVVNCLVDPCLNKRCEANPSATCKSNYCGGCNFDFFDANGGKVDCAPKPDPCNGLPIAQCAVDPCLNKRCEADPTATCKANYCGGCNFDFFDANGGKVDCAKKPDPCNGLPMVNCLVDPCLNKRCEAHPSATCKANYCGGCNFDFFDANGGKVDCTPDPCNGVPTFQCVAAPCSVVRCGNPAFAGAQCRNNYCGGCKAEFFVDGVWKECEGTSPCPAGVQLANCFARPCATAKCDAYPNAVCEDNYCGGCSAVWKVNGQVVDCGAKPPVDPPVCPTGVPQVQCLADPCKVTECPAYPNAQCRSDYCGGCRAIFTVEGRLVNCDASCLGLPCNKCTANPSCKFCSSSYATSSNAGVVENLGFCVAATGATETACTASNGQFITAAPTCPRDPIPTSDHTPVQDIIDNTVSSVREKFIIIITLMVNETANRPAGLNIVKMFIDLIGSGNPTDDDKIEICTILSAALTKVDNRVVRDNLSCSLDQEVAVKRNVAYVASLSFPGADNIDSTSASTQLIAASAALAAVAIAAF